jgi:hypothetical protein
MNNKSYSGTPVSSKPGLNNSKSLYHDFVRPRDQFSTKLGSFKGSPHPENFDFIPLSFSSPVNSTTKSGGGNWKGNRNSFVGSSANSSRNSSFSPYSMNRKYFHSSSSANSNSGFSPYNNMDTPRKYSSNRKRMVRICRSFFFLNKHIMINHAICTPAFKFTTILTCAFLFIG